MSFIHEESRFKALSCNIYKVGRRIKGSKIRFSWEFEIDGCEHTLDFYLSKLSRKRKLVLDGQIKQENRSTNAMLIYPIKIGNHVLVLYDTGSGNFDLRVDNLSFQTYLSKKIAHYSSGDREDSFSSQSSRRNSFDRKTDSVVNESRVFSSMEQSFSRREPYLKKEVFIRENRFHPSQSPVKIDQRRAVSIGKNISEPFPTRKYSFEETKQKYNQRKAPLIAKAYPRSSDRGEFL